MCGTDTSERSDGVTSADTHFAKKLGQWRQALDRYYEEIDVGPQPYTPEPDAEVLFQHLGECLALCVMPFVRQTLYMTHSPIERLFCSAIIARAYYEGFQVLF